MHQTDDPGSAFDWFSLAVTIFSLFLLICGSCYVYIKRRGRKLMKVGSFNIASMTLFGIIHMIATLICNDHFKEFVELTEKNCVLWTYWMQYFFGLFAWVTVFFMRLLHFADRFTSTDLRIKLTKKIILGLTLFLPIFILCVSISAENGSTFSSDIRQCTSGWQWKVALIVITGFSAIILMSFVRFLNDKIPNEHINEYKTVIDITMVGGAVLLIDGFFHFSSLNLHSYGRMVITCSVAFFHSFWFCRLLGYKIWVVFTDNAIVLQMFNHSYQILDPSDVNMDDITRNEQSRIEFLQFCKEVDNVGSSTGLTSYSIKNMTVLVEKCFAITKKWDMKTISYTPSDTFVKDVNNIVNFDVVDSYQKKIFLPSKIMRAAKECSTQSYLENKIKVIKETEEYLFTLLVVLFLDGYRRKTITDDMKRKAYFIIEQQENNENPHATNEKG